MYPILPVSSSLVNSQGIMARDNGGQGIASPIPFSSLVNTQGLVAQDNGGQGITSPSPFVIG